MGQITYGDLVAGDATQLLTTLRANANAPIPGDTGTGQAATAQIASKTRQGGANRALNAAYAGRQPVAGLRPMMTLTAAQMTERIGHNLKRAREHTGLSQQDAGERLDPPVRRNEIRRYEHGQHRPGEIRLLQFAAIYSVDPGYFYTEHDELEDGAA